MTLDLEDGQTALETLLTRKIGAAGARLHAGRSRNDQVLAALRLYLRDAVEDRWPTARAALRWRSSRLAVEQGHIELPGYTHMQQAMPSSVALWARGFAAEIADDADGAAPRAPPHPEEPARLGRGLRHARPAGRPRSARARGSTSR